MNAKACCPICSDEKVLPFFETSPVPVNCNRFFPSRTQALDAPTARVRLAGCPCCNHIFNPAFDPDLVDYDQCYNTTLRYSPAFRAYETALAAELLDQWSLQNKFLVDIGCGDGGFLAALCCSGNNTGLGLDPVYPALDTPSPLPPLMTVIPEKFSARHGRLSADFISCRHVLEHIYQVRSFVDLIKTALRPRPDSAVFIEVPHAAHLFEHTSVWDIIYEHVHYFSARSLQHLFIQAGFRVHRLRTAFGGQYLLLQASTNPDRPACKYLPLGFLPDFGQFANRCREKIRWVNQEIKQHFALKHKIVVWGGGSKGVTLLNCLEQPEAVGFVMDLNPGKHGRFTAGTGHQVVGLDFLKKYCPEVVVVMNKNYEAEIRTALADIGLSPLIIMA